MDALVLAVQQGLTYRIPKGFKDVTLSFMLSLIHNHRHYIMLYNDYPVKYVD